MARRKSSKRAQPRGIEQLAPGRVVNPLEPISILSEEEVASLHTASLEILKKHGMRFSLPEARNILREAGASIDEDNAMVRFDPDLVMEYVAKAPGAFTLHARNPIHHLHLDQRHINFSSVSSAPHATDSLNGRRAGNR